MLTRVLLFIFENPKLKILSVHSQPTEHNPPVELLKDKNHVFDCKVKHGEVVLQEKHCDVNIETPSDCIPLIWINHIIRHQSIVKMNRADPVLVPQFQTPLICSLLWSVLSDVH